MKSAPALGSPRCCGRAVVPLLEQLLAQQLDDGLRAALRHELEHETRNDEVGDVSEAEAEKRTAW